MYAIRSYYVVVELRDRVDGLPAQAITGGSASAAVPQDPQSEAVVSLQQLGYKPAEASRLAQKVVAEGDTAESIIRKALKAALGG